MIIINNFKKKYKDNLILDIDHFTFLKNKSYLIVGSNGSGKSTMIKCILGINKVSSGSITINTKNIAYIPEKYFFPEFCTIETFLKSILDLYQLVENECLIDYYCDRLNINKKKLLTKLSKGMQQKVLIIQSLIHNAELFIFDEPLNGLDPPSQKIFFDIIDELKLNSKTIIVTTHYPNFYMSKFDYYIKIVDRKLKYENY